MDQKGAYGTIPNAYHKDWLNSTLPWIWVTPLQHFVGAFPEGQLWTGLGLKGPYQTDVYVEKVPRPNDLTSVPSGDFQKVDRCVAERVFQDLNNTVFVSDVNTSNYWLKYQYIATVYSKDRDIWPGMWSKPMPVVSPRPWAISCDRANSTCTVSLARRHCQHVPGWKIHCLKHYKGEYDTYGSQVVWKKIKDEWVRAYPPGVGCAKVILGHGMSKRNEVLGKTVPFVADPTIIVAEGHAFRKSLCEGKETTGYEWLGPNRIYNNGTCHSPAEHWMHCGSGKEKHESTWIERAGMAVKGVVTAAIEEATEIIEEGVGNGAGCIRCGLTLDQAKILWDVTPALWCTECYVGHFPIQSARGIMSSKDGLYTPMIVPELPMDLETRAEVVFEVEIAEGRVREDGSCNRIPQCSAAEDNPDTGPKPPQQPPSIPTTPPEEPPTLQREDPVSKAYQEVKEQADARVTAILTQLDLSDRATPAAEVEAETPCMDELLIVDRWDASPEPPHLSPVPSENPDVLLLQADGEEDVFLPSEA
ncbi:hypothetical protein D5F01_LYC16165 [Larimichthys crocea]|uniref:Uncharacterized protein n=1 Tax=Larimichthys crocea TaxID=215358 RepID=A0A6G0I0D8_LARCR|nr:hypothetical protein D5F01_LYC16165 [Larimichthys crocea]